MRQTGQILKGHTRVDSYSLFRCVQLPELSKGLFSYTDYISSIYQKLGTKAEMKRHSTRSPKKSVLGLEIELKMSSSCESSSQNLPERREAAVCLFFLKQLLQKNTRLCWTSNNIFLLEQIRTVSIFLKWETQKELKIEDCTPSTSCTGLGRFFSPALFSV